MQVEWKRTNDQFDSEPARTILVYRSGDDEPHLWKTSPSGFDHPWIGGGYDWFAEFSFNLPTRQE